MALDLLVSGISFSWWLQRHHGQVREGGKSGRWDGAGGEARSCLRPWAKTVSVRPESLRRGEKLVRSPGSWASWQPFAQGPEAGGGTQPLARNRAQAEPQGQGSLPQRVKPAREGSAPKAPLPLGIRLLCCALQEKDQSPSDSPWTGCQGYECYKELLQLLKDNRALMRMCLSRPLCRG